MHGIVDEKTDVFAYGVLLLELITGRRAIDNSQQSLVMWVSTFMTTNPHPQYNFRFTPVRTQVVYCGCDLNNLIALKPHRNPSHPN